MRRLRGLRRRLSSSLGAAEELARVREELAAVRAAYARDAAVLIAHRAAWDRERAELLRWLGRPSLTASTAEAERALDRLYGDLIDMDERRAR